MISISETKRNNMGQGLENTEGRQNSYFFFFQKRLNYYGGMSGGIVIKKTDMLKTSDRASFLIIRFQFLKYYVFIVLPSDTFALFKRHFYCDSFTRLENCIQNLLCTQRPLGIYWAFVVFSGPDCVANFSDGLKIMDPSVITCDDIGKLTDNDMPTFRAISRTVMYVLNYPIQVCIVFYRVRRRSRDRGQ
jgi:hypothetical protein